MERGRIQITGYDSADADSASSVRDGSKASSSTETTSEETESQWQRAFAQFRANRSAMFGVAVVIIMALVSLFARPVSVFGVTVQPFELVLHDPDLQHYFEFADGATGTDPNAAPWDNPGQHPLGTDSDGRDLFSRVLVGGRYSLSIGFIVVAITGTIGVIYGSISGYYGGVVDEAMMRFVDVIFAFPALLLALVIVTVLDGGYWALVLAFVIPGWAGYARLIRGEILSVKENEYVTAAKALGARDRSVIFRHVVPNAIAPVIVQASLTVGTVVIGVAALGFLGVGFEPGTPEWGMILDANLGTLQNGPGGQFLWWQTFFPGAAIFTFVMAMNLIGDGINDALDAQAANERIGGGG
jgi:peptide/nickel transport system permease protein